MENCDLRDLQSKYPLDKFNLLIPVTQIIDIADIQKVIINIVQINTDEKAKEIYYDKANRGYALTKIGLTKLASAANIHYLSTNSVLPQACERCSEVAQKIGRFPECNKCPNRYDVKIAVSVEAPKTDGSLTKLTLSKELRMEELKNNYDKPEAYKRFFDYRNEQCESRAFNRAIRAALSLPAIYSIDDLKKPFAVAHLAPNLDNPDVKNAVLEGYRNSIQNLFVQNIKYKNSKQVLEQIKAGKDTIQIEDKDDNTDDSKSTFKKGKEKSSNSIVSNNNIADDNNSQLLCSICGNIINPNVYNYSKGKFGKPLCYDCQHKEPK